MLRKLIKFFVRAVPALLLCCMFMMLFSPAVSAEGVDYKDYISNIEVDGTNDLVTVTIPANKQYWLFKNSTDKTGLVVGENGYLDFACDIGDNLELYLCAFDPYLNLADIPNNTSFSFGFRFDWLGSYTDDYGLPYVIMQQFYRDDNMSNLGEGSLSFGKVPLSGDFQGTGSILKVRPSGTATRMEFRLTMVDFIAGSNWFEFQALPFTMTMSISSLYRLQQETGRTNQLLEAVEDKLDQNGQKLDEIINGEVTPDLPEGSDTVTDLEDAEGALRDDAQAGLDEGTELQQNALEILLEYAGAFAIYSRIVGLFTNIPFIYGLLAISLALGSVSVILSIGVSAGHNYSKAQAKAQAKSRKKGG